MDERPRRRVAVVFNPVSAGEPAPPRRHFVAEVLPLALTLCVPARSENESEPLAQEREEVADP